MQTQFNVRIAKRLSKRVEGDARNTTKAIVTEVALESWFSIYPAERRAAFYRAHSRKPYARQ